MDDVGVTLAIFRGLERLFVVLGAFGAIYLGAMLFKWGVSGQASIRVRHDESRLQLENAAPGIFFCLFGAAVLCFALFNKLEMREGVVLFSGHRGTLDDGSSSDGSLGYQYGAGVDEVRRFVVDVSKQSEDEMTKEDFLAFQERARELLAKSELWDSGGD